MLVLCVHDIVGPYAEQTWEVAEHDLEHLLTIALERGYSPSTLDDLPEAPDRSFALTVDDGASAAAEWLLRRASTFGIRATVFVVVNWLDDPPPRSPDHAYRGLASWEHVTALADAGHLIGSHSMTHTRLPGLPADRIAHELHASKQRLEAVSGAAVRHFAAPFGRLSPGVIDEAWAAGYVTVNSTVPGVNGPEERRSGVLKRHLLRSDEHGMGLPPLEDLLP